MTIDNLSLGTYCIICGESVPLTQNEEMSLRYGHCIHSKVCDKCKAAVLRMREQVEQEEIEFEKEFEHLLNPCGSWR